MYVMISVTKYCKIFFMNFIFNFNTISVVGIIGGYNVDIDEVPYQVNYGDLCGGVLIHKKWVLTSAHCGKLNFVRVGSKHRLLGSKVYVISHKIHPKYGQQHEFDYDVQLLRLRHGLHFHKSVSAIELGGCQNGDYVSVQVSGWGYSVEKGNYEDILKQVQLKVKPIDTCQNVTNFWYNHTLTPRMFCAGGERSDACQGDSGGGAVAAGQLVGISSFGYGCGRGIPGVFVNVSDNEIMDWIRYYTGI